MPEAWRSENTIHFETHGAGPSILLTHGFGATCRMWDEQIEEFTDRYQMILWDLPAHGQSGPRPPDGMTADRLVEEMAAVLDRAAAGRAVLVGLGIGGSLSLRFWRAHPSRVRGLILIGVIPGFREPLTREFWNDHIEQMASGLDTNGLKWLEGGAEVDPQAHEDAKALAAAARAMLTRNDEGCHAWLTEIDVPVLVLAGGEDKPTLTAARYMARRIEDARLVIVPRANHAVNIHKPAPTNKAIREFLAMLPP